MAARSVPPITCLIECLLNCNLDHPINGINERRRYDCGIFQRKMRKETESVASII